MNSSQDNTTTAEQPDETLAEANDEEMEEDLEKVRSKKKKGIIDMNETAVALPRCCVVVTPFFIFGAVDPFHVDLRITRRGYSVFFLERPHQQPLRVFATVVGGV